MNIISSLKKTSFFCNYSNIAHLGLRVKYINMLYPFSKHYAYIYLKNGYTVFIHKMKFPTDSNRK